VKSKLMAISVSLLLALMVTPVIAKSIGPQKAVKNPHITIMPEGVELLLPSGVAHEWVADTEISVMDIEHILNASKFKIRNAMPITIEDLMEIMTDPEAALQAENKWGYMSYQVMEDFFEWLISIGYPVTPEEVELILSMYPEGMYIMFVNVGK